MKTGTWLAVLIIVAACVTAFAPDCAGAQSINSEVGGPIPLGHGRVFIYRYEKEGWHVRPAVRLNGQPVERIKPQSYFWLDLPAGAHEISAAARTNFVAQLDVAAGQKYFVRVELDQKRSTLRFRPVEVAQAKAIAQLNRLGYQGFVGIESVNEHIVILGDVTAESALESRLLATGRDVISGNDGMSKEAVQNATIVFIVGKWPDVASTIEGQEWMEGKVVVDLTEPQFEWGEGSPETSLFTSVAEEIQRLYPGAQVVKAMLDTAERLNSSESAAVARPVPVASDFAMAKHQAGRTLAQLGFAPVDFGPLRFARQIEVLQAVRRIPETDGRSEAWDVAISRDWRSKCYDDEEFRTATVEPGSLAKIARLYGETQVTCFELLED
jgi:predicted dinucleotide-binding enzyme